MPVKKPCFSRRDGAAMRTKEHEAALRDSWGRRTVRTAAADASQAPDPPRLSCTRGRQGR
jgi:hypothetical protein